MILQRCAILLLVSFTLLALPVFVQAQTTPVADLQSLVELLQAQVKALQEQVVSLQAQLQTTKEEIAEVKTELKLASSLARGASGDEVRQLQEFLKTLPDIYPEGLVSGYFGPKTEAAVRRFQEKNKIESIGVVGPKTILKINELFAGGAGRSGVVPPGLLAAPSIQVKLTTMTTATATTTTLPIISTTTLPFITPLITSTTATTTTITIATTTVTTATTEILPQPPATQPAPVSSASAVTNTTSTTTSTTSVATTTTLTTTGTTAPTSPTTATISHACGTTISVPQETTSIQIALNSACSGDTIYIGAGTYYENLVVSKANITLKGASGTSAESVIIDGQGADDVIKNERIASFTVEGLTIQNSKNSSGKSGIFVNPIWNGTFTIRGVILKSNHIGIRIINMTSGSVTIERSLIINNNNVGISDGHFGTATLYLINNTIAGNVTGYDDPGGGGQHIIKNNIIASNSSMGINVNKNSSRTISYNNFWQNAGGNYMEWYYAPVPFAPQPGTGELSADPKFVSSSDFHLQSSSPMINAGDPAVLDSNGTRSDIGAYYFQGTIAPTSSITVTYPNGGEEWDYGYNYTVSYAFNGVSQVGLKVLKGSQVVYESTTPKTAGATGGGESLDFSRNNTNAIAVGSGSDYKVRIFDWNNPQVYDESNAYFTLLPADITPPVASSVSASSITTSSAIISWTTDEPANGYVNYGSALSGPSADWTITPYDNSWAGYVTSHSYTLPNLKNNTLYTYRVYSTDAKGNGPEGYPPSYTFTTLISGSTATTTTSAASEQNLASLLGALASLLQNLQRSLR